MTLYWKFNVFQRRWLHRIVLRFLITFKIRKRLVHEICCYIWPALGNPYFSMFSCSDVCSQRVRVLTGVLHVLRVLTCVVNVLRVLTCVINVLRVLTSVLNVFDVRPLFSTSYVIWHVLSTFCEFCLVLSTSYEFWFVLSTFYLSLIHIWRCRRRG